MTTKKSVKKNRLFPIEYDEISLVDSGAGEDANVLISKRNRKGKKRKEGSPMGVEVVEKRKGGLTCGECGTGLAAGTTECPEDGSTNIRKSLVIVRKSISDDGSEVEDEEIVDEEDVDEDDSEDEDESEEEEEEEFEEDEDSDDEEDEEEEEEDDSAPSGVKKADPDTVALEALGLSTAFAEDIAKVFSGNVSRTEYEDTMTQFNEVMDTAADGWFTGNTISKSEDGKKNSSLIRERVNGIINKEGTETMPRPKNFDSLDDETKNYIKSLEGEEYEEVGKKYADLPEEVQKSLNAADKIVEEREVEKWEGIAKSYKNFSGDKSDLAKTLRSLSESNPDAFEELKKTLDSAEKQLEESEVFKSFGAPGGSENMSDKETAAAKELVAKGDYETLEQAQVALMDGESYTATNS